MKSQNFENIEKALEKKSEKRGKKKRPKMKVSGARVKQLSRIIKTKS